MVIVAYDSAAEIGACLASVEGAGHEVVVVDNSPGSETAEAVAGFPGVRLIRPGRNLGFAGGVNAGVRATRAPLILLLNPDCVLETSLDGLEFELGDPRVGAAGGQLLGADGRAQAGFQVRRFPTAAALSCEILGLNRLFPWNRINRWYRALDLPLDAPADVDQPAGAFLLIRREAFDAVGGFDECFHPVWFEDVDFCQRLKTAGWRIRFTPLARARHAGGHSVGRMAEASKTLAWYGSLLKYSVKHLGSAGSKVVSVSVMLAALPRGVLGSFRAGTLSPLWSQWAVFFRAMWILIGRTAG